MANETNSKKCGCDRGSCCPACEAQEALLEATALRLARAERFNSTLLSDSAFRAARR